MSLERYLLKYTAKPDKTFPILSEEKAVALFQEAKALFFNSNINKWSSIKKATAYVSSKGIEPEIFILFFEHITEAYYENSKHKKGRKSALGFIRDLHKSKSFNSCNNIFRIELRPGVSAAQFLQAAKEFNSLYLAMTHDEMVEILQKKVDTGLSNSTLRRYYFDQQK